MRRLYVQGTIPQEGVAIIGSRQPPPGTADFAFELARRMGKPIVAGLALGIDTAAHRGAIAGGSPTVAFVGYGFGQTYPPENVALEREILAAGGGIATLREPGETITQAALVQRDRLQAEYAAVIVLVVSDLEGGAMHTLRFAAELSKPRFAVSPPLEAQGRSEWSGNLRALADGARPLPFNVDEALRIIHDRLPHASA